MLTTAPRPLSVSRLTSSGVRALMDALPSNVALLDAEGVIVATNRAWNAHAAAQGLKPAQAGVGVDYLATCDSAASDLNEGGARFGAGLRQLLLGRSVSFEMDDRLVQDGETRVVRGRATRIEDPSGTWVLVTHQDMSLRALDAA
jgi:PAS domain-containing protein